MERWLEVGVIADPGRVHTEGREARVAVENSREAVAGMLGVRPRQVVFTSGGTEAANAAVWGTLTAAPNTPVLVSDVEHSSVRDAVARSRPEGKGRIVKIAVDELGRIQTSSVEEALSELARCKTRATPGATRAEALVNCQLANHEVGTLQPVAEVAEICERHGAILHVDACAAAGHVPLELDELGAHLVSISAHKFGGPTGIGAIVIKRGLRIAPFLVGGDQERARRAGLENSLGIVGFGAAASELSSPGRLAREAEDNRLQTERLLEAATRVDGVEILGDPKLRVPHIVCLSVRGVEAEPVLVGLDRVGIAAHSGSSCSSESLSPSPVLEAMGVDAERSLRLSVGWSTTDGDIRAFADRFEGVVENLRALRSGGTDPGGK